VTGKCRVVRWGVFPPTATRSDRRTPTRRAGPTTDSLILLFKRAGTKRSTLVLPPHRFGARWARRTSSTTLAEADGPRVTPPGRPSRWGERSVVVLSPAPMKPLVATYRPAASDPDLTFADAAALVPLPARSSA